MSSPREACYWLPNITERLRVPPARSRRRQSRGRGKQRARTRAQCIVGRKRRVTALPGPPSCLRPDLLPLSGPAPAPRSAKRRKGRGRGPRPGGADARRASSHLSRAPLAKGAGVVGRLPARPLLSSALPGWVGPAAGARPAPSTPRAPSTTRRTGADRGPAPGRRSGRGSAPSPGIASGTGAASPAPAPAPTRPPPPAATGIAIAPPPRPTASISSGAR